MGTLLWGHLTLRRSPTCGDCVLDCTYEYTELDSLLVRTIFKTVHATCTFWAIDTDGTSGRGKGSSPTSQKHFCNLNFLDKWHRQRSRGALTKNAKKFLQTNDAKNHFGKHD